MNDVVDEQPAEDFSPLSARDAIDAMFNALPTNRRAGQIGAFNEVMVTLVALARKAGVGPDTAGWRKRVP